MLKKLPTTPVMAGSERTGRTESGVELKDGSPLVVCKNIAGNTECSSPMLNRRRASCKGDRVPDEVWTKSRVFRERQMINPSYSGDMIKVLGMNPDVLSKDDTIRAILYHLQKQKPSTYVQCCRPDSSCGGRWFLLSEDIDLNDIPRFVTCSSPLVRNSPETDIDPETMPNLDSNLEFSCGSVVWVKYAGPKIRVFPAMIDFCPDNFCYAWYDGDEDESKDPEWYHVVFFGGTKVTRQWVETFNISRFCTEGPEWKDLRAMERKAAKVAVEAKHLAVKDRLERFSFLSRFEGSFGGLSGNRSGNNVKGKREKYRKGKILTGIKRKLCQEVVNPFVGDTDDDLPAYPKSPKKASKVTTKAAKKYYEEMPCNKIAKKDVQLKKHDKIIKFSEAVVRLTKAKKVFEESMKQVELCIRELTPEISHDVDKKPLGAVNVQSLLNLQNQSPRSSPGEQKKYERPVITGYPLVILASMNRQGYQNAVEFLKDQFPYFERKKELAEKIVLKIAGAANFLTKRSANPFFNRAKEDCQNCPNLEKSMRFPFMLPLFMLNCNTNVKKFKKPPLTWSSLVDISIVNLQYVYPLKMFFTVIEINNYIKAMFPYYYQNQGSIEKIPIDTEQTNHERSVESFLSLSRFQNDVTEWIVNLDSCNQMRNNCRFWQRQKVPSKFIQ